VASLPAEQQSAISSDVERRKATRAKRGPVDSSAIRERLKPHLRDLDEDERKTADKLYKHLQRHHEELTPQRIAELIEQSESMMADAEDEITKQDIGTRLSMLNHMLAQTNPTVARREKEKQRAINKLTNNLQPFANEPLTPDDITQAASEWASMKADYGEHVIRRVYSEADKLIDQVEEKDKIPTTAVDKPAAEAKIPSVAEAKPNEGGTMTTTKLAQIQSETTNPIILSAIAKLQSLGKDVKNSGEVSRAIMERENELGADAVDAANEELDDIRIKLFGAYEK
jgi:hypothetical protein